MQLDVEQLGGYDLVSAGIGRYLVHSHRQRTGKVLFDARDLESRQARTSEQVGDNGRTVVGILCDHVAAQDSATVGQVRRIDAVAFDVVGVAARGRVEMATQIDRGLLETVGHRSLQGSDCTGRAAAAGHLEFDVDNSLEDASIVVAVQHAPLDQDWQVDDVITDNGGAVQ